MISKVLYLKKFSPIFCLFFISQVLFSQNSIKYQTPPASLYDFFDFQTEPIMLPNGKHDCFVLLYGKKMSTIDEFYKPKTKIAGMDINPTTTNRTFSGNTNIKIKYLTHPEENIQVTGLPSKPEMTEFNFSPDKSRLAFLNATEDGIELWCIDLKTHLAKQLTGANVCLTYMNGYHWINNETILVKLLPKDRPPFIFARKEAEGPVIFNSLNSQHEYSSYLNLNYNFNFLNNKTDETNLENLLTSELYKINVVSGTSTFFRARNLYTNILPSPDGHYALLSTFIKPLPYNLSIIYFPFNTKLCDLQTGEDIKVCDSSFLYFPLPNDSIGDLTFSKWRGDKPSTLSYVQRYFKKDTLTHDAKTEVFNLTLPINKPATSIVKLKQTLQSINWGNDTVAFIREKINSDEVRVYLFNPADNKIPKKLAWSIHRQDNYNDPGNIKFIDNSYGRSVVALKGNKVILIGDGFTSKGQFPFVDEFDITTFKTKRVYQSAYSDKKERIKEIFNPEKDLYLVSIESQSEKPNTYVRNISKKKNNLTQLTFESNSNDKLKNIHQEVIRYTRKDGVPLSGTLYLPAGYNKNSEKKLPLLIWAYPLDYKSNDIAGQNTLNDKNFKSANLNKFSPFVTMGYAVLEDASFPIIGEGHKYPNDTYLPQLIANAEAAIDAVDKLGYIDRQKVAIGGHSYGAVMAATLLTQTNLFVCGIAKSGAYNLSLTPYGFQYESRTYWEAPAVYNGCSPFMSADKMKKPLLLFHGDKDNNKSTPVIQTKLYYTALNLLKAPVRMVILPEEDHGYSAKESILHVLWEENVFFEHYLKENK